MVDADSSADANTQGLTVVASPIMASHEDVFAVEQLAELHLLSRVEHHGDGSTPSSTPALNGEQLENELPDLDIADDQDMEEDISFTARLVASRRLVMGHNVAVSPPVHSDNASVLSSVMPPAPSTCISSDRAKRATLLPTLCEHDDEDEPDDGDGHVSAALTQDPTVSDADCRKANPNAVESTDILRASNEPLLAHTRTASRDATTQSTIHDNPCDDDQSADCDLDPAIENMLQLLAFDVSALELSADALSVRLLRRVRDALASEMHPGTDGSSPPARMRRIRTIMAVDTLRMLLERFEEEDVLLAATVALRIVFDRNTRESSMTRTRGLLTSENITRVVLMTRESLIDDRSRGRERVHPYSVGIQTNSTSTTITPSSVRAPQPLTGIASPQSSIRSLPYFPRSMSSPHPFDSQATPGSSRRSILAMDGTHVLMNEKISAFEHRPRSKGLEAFKVRRDSATHVAAAAGRRHRSLHYHGTP